MKKNWGNLKDREIKLFQGQLRKLSKNEIDERFTETKDEVKFKIFTKTDRSVAGGLDIDLGEDVDIVERSRSISFTRSAEDAEEIDLEMSEAQEIEELEETEVTLISPADFDYEPKLTPEDLKAAKGIDQEMDKLSQHFATEATAVTTRSGEASEMAASLPNSIDHRISQSNVKNQGGRGTCVAHASCGCLEAFSHIPDDLSEQYLHYKFNEFMGRPHNSDQGLKTTNAAGYLARSDGRICEEQDWVYKTQDS